MTNLLIESLTMTKERLATPEEFFTKYPLSFDHDGVIANTRGHVVKKVNKELGTNYVVADIDDWFWARNALVEHGWDDDSATEFNNKQWFDKDSLFEVPPTEGAVEFLKWLYDRDLDYHVITSREPQLRESTLGWYQTHAPFVDEERIIISPVKERRGDFFKVWAVKFLVNPAVHIEDSTDHAKLILDYTDTAVGYMSSSKTLDYLNYPNLIRLLDSESEPTFKGVREKIMDSFVFGNVAQY